MSTTKRDRKSDEEFEEAVENKKPVKVAKKAPTEEAVFSIGGKRKVTVSVFKGLVLVNIREFYEDKATGQEKPGNKGIALSFDQWRQFKAQMNEIDDAVKERKDL